MRKFVRWFSMVGFVGRRLRSHIGLLLAVWAGLTLAVAIVVSIPIYAESAGYRILLSALEATDEQDQIPPFSLVYSYEGSSGPSLSLPQYRQVDSIASDVAASGVAVSSQRSVRYASTERLRLLWEVDGEQLQLSTARLAFVSDFVSQVQIVDGERPSEWNGSGPMDVLVARQAADDLNLLVGDEFRLVGSSGLGGALNLTVRIAGFWEPTDEDSDYWFFPPSTFNQMVVVPEESFAVALQDPNARRISYAAWYTALDTSAVRSEDISGLLNRVNAVTRNLERVLPGVKLVTSPVEALERHRNQVRLLTLTLALFSIPLLGLIGYFVAQLAGLLVQRQQQEIAVLRSRGSSRVQVVALAVGEGLALSLAALLSGLMLGLGVAQALLWTEGFLRFAPLPGPPVRLLSTSWQHGVLALLLALPAIVLPGLRASGRTIIGFKQERARAIRKPFWKRVYLDVLLLAVALYGLVQLRRNGLIGVPGVTTAADDPFRNPLLMLAPALFVFSLALVALRVVPLMLALLARALARTRGVALLTLRFLSRSTQTYSAPILLITLTLSLAAYTASMARTLNTHSAERARYNGGADARLVYRPPSVDMSGGGATGGSTPSGGGGAAAADAAGAEFITTPVDEFLDIPGVEAATRVAPSDVTLIPASGVAQEGVFLGVDRVTLGPVLEESWRSDFSPEPLGSLLNQLAFDPSAILLSSRYATEQGLNVGDRMTLRMTDVGESREVPFVVAGTVEYFPTLFPEGQPFAIGNLEYSYEAQGGPYQYQVWLDLAPNSRMDVIEGAVYRYNLQVQEDTPSALLSADVLRPERQGLFGLLSVGFLAAAVVTVIGFLASTLVSFQRRLVEMGTLRAMGLSTRQLAAMLVAEQALMIGVGVAVGIGLGVLASRLFVPFLQVRSGEFPDTPSFLVRIAWEQIALICSVAGLLLVLAVVITLWLLRRMKIFQAVKLGEAV